MTMADTNHSDPSDKKAPAATSLALLHQLLGNAGLVFAAHMVSNVSLMIMNWAVIRGAGTEVHGRATVLLSISGLAVFVSDLGLASKSGIRVIARLRTTTPDRLSSDLTTLVWILAATGAGCAVGVFFGSPWLGHRLGLAPAHVRMVAAWVAGAAAVRLAFMIAIGYERMRYLLGFTICSELSRCVWALWCFRVGASEHVLYLGWTVVWAAAFVMVLLLTGRLLRTERVSLFGRIPSRAELAAKVWEGLPYFVPNLAMISLPALTFLLTGLRHKHLVSGLQVCFSLALAGRVFSQPLATAFFPLVSRLTVATDRREDHLPAVAEDVVRLLMVILTGIFAALSLFGGSLLVWLYGTPYGELVMPLLILVFGLGVDCYRAQLDQVLMGTGHVWISAVFESLKLALLPLLFWALTDSFGALGVAFAVAGCVLIPTVARVVVMVSLRTPTGLAPALAGLAVFGVLGVVVQVPFGRWLAVPLWVVTTFCLRLWRVRDVLAVVRVVTVRFRGPLSEQNFPGG